MKRSRFTEEAIIGILREQEAGVTTRSAPLKARRAELEVLLAEIDEPEVIAPPPRCGPSLRPTGFASA